MGSFGALRMLVWKTRAAEPGRLVDLVAIDYLRVGLGRGELSTASAL